jgi:hypothetical protein
MTADGAGTQASASAAPARPMTARTLRRGIDAHMREIHRLRSVVMRRRRAQLCSSQSSSWSSRRTARSGRARARRESTPTLPHCSAQAGVWLSSHDALGRRPVHALALGSKRQCRAHARIPAGAQRSTSAEGRPPEKGRGQRARGRGPNRGRAWSPAAADVEQACPLPKHLPQLSPLALPRARKWTSMSTARFGLAVLIGLDAEVLPGA